MANRYWVGGAATWDGTAGSKWATSSGGAGGAAVPTAADDVFLDASSGANTVTLGGTPFCRSLNCTGFTGTLSHASAITLTIGDGTAGASNVALKLVAGMTYTVGSFTTSQITFVNSVGTAQTIDCGGKTLPNVLFNNSSGNWQLTSAMTLNSASSLNLGGGTLDTNNQTCSWGIFNSSNTNVRTLTLGSSAVTVTGTGWSTATSTSMTLNAGTSSITFNPTAAVTPTFASGGLAYYDMSIIKSAGGFSPTGGGSFHNLTMDNTVLGTGNRVLQLVGGSTYTFTGTLTYKANNATSSRGRIVSDNPGVAVTIALGATGTAAFTDADIIDVAVTGTNTPVVAAAGRLANGGGNSGITFPSAVTYYWIGNGGSMTDPTKYSTSSGGSAGSVVPLIHDTLVFDANSITTGGQTIVNNMMRMPGIDFSNVLNSPVYNPQNPSGANNWIFGSFIMKSGMTVSDASAAGSIIPHVFLGRSTYSLDFAGVDMLTTFSVQFTCPSGTYSLQSNMTLASTRSLSLSAGTFNANGYNVSTGLISSSNSTIRSIVMGSGAWSLTGSSANILNISISTNLTITPGTSTFNITAASSSGTRGLLGGGSTVPLNNVNVTAGTDTLQFNNFACNNLDLTGFSGAVTTATNGSFVAGNFTVPSSVTSFVGGVSFNFNGTSGTKTITTNGIMIDNPINVNAPGATVQLADNLTVGSTRSLTFTNGTFNLNNNNLSAGLFSSSNSNTRTLTLGSGTVTLSGSGTVWNLGTTTGLTFNANTSTIVISDTSSSSKTFTHGTSQALNNISITSGGTGAIVINGSGNKTYNNFTVTGTSSKTIQLTNAVTHTFNGTISVSGASGNVVTITSTTGGSQTTMLKSTGIVSADYVSLQDVVGSGGATWYAGDNSTSVSNNLGWIFMSPTTSQKAASMLGFF